MEPPRDDASHQYASSHVCTIIPDYILQDIADSPEFPQPARDSARHTLTRTQLLRKARSSLTHGRSASIGDAATSFRVDEAVDPDQASGEDRHRARRTLAGPEATSVARPSLNSNVARQWRLNRIIYDAEHTSALPSPRVIRQEGEVAIQDDGANEVYDSFGKTYEFYKEVFNRNSLDDGGLNLVGSIHYDDLVGRPGYNNAGWVLGHYQMVFGDGDGTMFGSLTKSLDVIAHELTHGMTEHIGVLPFHLQSGALNEHMSDVVGSMVKQYHLNRQEARDADWLIGKDILASGFRGRALRDMKAPGTAYDDPRLGGRTDRQVGHMDEYVFLPDADDPNSDNGGVHINSGIPNRAFHIVAITLGGHSWDVAGQVWYKTLLDPRLGRFTARRVNWDNCFPKFAGLTCMHALEYGEAVQTVVRDAWAAVGVTPTHEVLGALI